MEDQNSNERSTKEHTSKGLSRRNLVKGVAATSVITTLTAKSSLASANVCTISGFTSVNPSGVERHEVDVCDGTEPGDAFSPGGWANPDSGNGDGSRAQWHAAGCYPNPRDGVVPADPAATKFSAIFSDASQYSHMISSDVSLHDVIDRTKHRVNGADQYDRHCAANYLNAKYLGWDHTPGRMSSSEIVRLHYALRNHQTSYVSDSGSIVDFSGVDILEFLNNLYH